MATSFHTLAEVQVPLIFLMLTTAASQQVIIIYPSKQLVIYTSLRNQPDMTQNNFNVIGLQFLFDVTFIFSISGMFTSTWTALLQANHGCNLCQGVSLQAKHNQGVLKEQKDRMVVFRADLCFYRQQSMILLICCKVSCYKPPLLN